MYVFARVRACVRACVCRTYSPRATSYFEVRRSMHTVDPWTVISDGDEEIERGWWFASAWNARQVSLKHLDVIHRWRSSFHSPPPSRIQAVFSVLCRCSRVLAASLGFYCENDSCSAEPCCSRRSRTICYERERERERKGPGSRAFCFLPAMLNKPIWRSRSSARNGERQLATFLVFKNTYRSPRRVSFFLDERTFPYYYI